MRRPLLFLTVDEDYLVLMRKSGREGHPVTWNSEGLGELGRKFGIGTEGIKWDLAGFGLRSGLSQ